MAELGAREEEGTAGHGLDYRAAMDVNSYKGADSFEMDVNPYKGADSFEVEDGRRFFGRQRESAELVARILSSRVTVLHAPSGAGKTSLLNARIVPALEAHRWLVVRARPGIGADPVGEIRLQTLASLFPPPEAELALMVAAQKMLNLDDSSSLDELIRQFDSVSRKGDPTSMKILETASRVSLDRFTSGDGITPDHVRTVPYMSRILRGTADARDLVAHWRAVGQAATGGPIGAFDVSSETRLGDLAALLSNVDLSRAYRALLAWLQQTPEGLRPLFESLAHTYGRELPRFAIVLILDQFEEIFTRFTGKSKALEAVEAESNARYSRPHSERRDELFKELENLYGGSDARASQGGDSEDEDNGELDFPRGVSDPSTGSTNLPSSILPIRYVVSLRDEYVARLGWLRRLAHDGITEYRLDLLSKRDAREAIQEPAKPLGYVFSGSCASKIIDALKVEDREIEPGPLQIVCRKLWTFKPARQQDAPPLTIIIGDDVLEAAAASAGYRDSVRRDAPLLVLSVLQTFFTDALGVLTATIEKQLSAEASEGRPSIPNNRVSEFVQLEVLDILQPLLTGDRTRNIVQRKTLEHAPFRRSKLRRLLLDGLETSRILRKETRLNVDQFEITHEFLIDPIFRALRKDTYLRLREALEGLKKASAPEDLNALVFDTLNNDMEFFEWDHRTSRLMLGAAVLYGARRSDLLKWAGDYQQEAERAYAAAGASSMLPTTIRRRAEFLTTEAELRQAARALILSEAPLTVTELSPLLEEWRIVKEEVSGHGH